MREAFQQRIERDLDIGGWKGWFLVAGIPGGHPERGRTGSVIRKVERGLIGNTDIVRTAMTTVIASTVLHAVVVGTTVIGWISRPVTENEHLGDIPRNTDLIHVRGPGEVREQNEKDQHFSNYSIHVGKSIQILFSNKLIYWHWPTLG